MFYEQYPPSPQNYNRPETSSSMHSLQNHGPGDMMVSHTYPPYTRAAVVSSNVQVRCCAHHTGLWTTCRRVLAKMLFRCLLSFHSSGLEMFLKVHLCIHVHVIVFTCDKTIIHCGGLLIIGVNFIIAHVL